MAETQPWKRKPTPGVHIASAYREDGSQVCLLCSLRLLTSSVHIATPDDPFVPGSDVPGGWFDCPGVHRRGHRKAVQME